MNQASPHRLGMLGFGKHPWCSVDRTRRFYLAALEREFDLVFMDEAMAAPSVDAVLSFCGEAGFRLLETSSVPMLFAIHGGATLELAKLREHAALMRRSDTLIVNCRSDIAILSKLFATDTPRFCRLPLPANPACFELIEQAEARAQLPFKEPPDLVLGFIARLTPQKNLHHFLTMVAQLSQRLAPRRVHGVVVGEYWVDYPVLPYVTREYRSFVAELAAALGIKDRIVYLGGKLDDADMRLVYGSLDLLLHPTSSIDENFGYVPVEAMACGVPVVGAAYGGLKDTVVHGETGYLMPTWTTASGLRMDLLQGCRAAARILTDEGLRRRLAASARQRALSSYNFESCADILAHAVRAALSASAAGPRLMTTPEPEPPPAQGYLPHLELGWEHYWPSVADYVSGPPPRVGADTQVCLAASASIVDSALVLCDPAWPATIAMSPEELRICEVCQSTTSAAELATDAGVLQALVERGALIASNDLAEQL